MTAVEFSSSKEGLGVESKEELADCFGNLTLFGFDPASKKAIIGNEIIGKFIWGVVFLLSLFQKPQAFFVALLTIPFYFNSTVYEFSQISNWHIYQFYIYAELLAILNLLYLIINLLGLIVWFTNKFKKIQPINLLKRRKECFAC